ncbi:hypothetical protein TPR58_15000 [Sphingomonas sp. HF-S3]|uniref:DUF4189 domain-containing protein n=1 Tax=Sphingomonas rustica TaxID=3103142 RepID=A0ABV0BDM0_9SPHN
MLKKITLAALIGAPLLWAAPALAQNASTNGVLVIYGNDKCPTNSSGEEIVVCQRLDEAERFRIPSNLRDAEVRPQARESWAVRQQDALTAGDTGTGSCSSVGASGATGCFVRQATQARREARQREEAANVLPLP